jgi:predicted ferric reductase
MARCSFGSYLTLAYLFVAGVSIIDQFDMSGINVSTYIGVEYYGLTFPLFITGMACLVLVTRGSLPLPHERLSWLFAPFRALRKLPQQHHKNQYGQGDIDFNVMSIWFFVIPCLALFVQGNIEWRDPTTKAADKLFSLSLNSGFIGTTAMSFFLIPVSRHNVLLAAMNWSPVHALRLHVWSGYLAFYLLEFHGVTIFIYLLIKGDIGEGKMWRQTVPPSKCWVWHAPSEEEDLAAYEAYEETCGFAWWNLTGVIAGTCLLVLVGTSYHWVRRQHYRLFYLSHIGFGSLTIIFSLLHWPGAITFLAPSILYYIASMTPALIQALASRFRGGVDISSVHAIPDSGQCVEVCIPTTVQMGEMLEREASTVVRMCVPSISMVWHPFTVYKHPRDATTVGPFTKTLAARLPDRPVMILDGLFRGGDRIAEALTHDVVVIVCGGVAVTPFMSMIPLVLQAVKGQEKSGASIVTRKLVLHYACREAGLLTFMETYFQVYREIAEVMPNFELQIVVYRTGSATEATKDETLAKIDPPTPVLGVEEVTDFDAETNSKESSTSLPDGADGETDSKESSSASPSGKHVDSPTVDKKLGSAAQKGHAMEHHRFMPAIHSGIVANLPHAVMMGLSLLFGMVLVNHFVDTFQFKTVYHYSGPVSTFFYILVSLGLAVIFEAVYFYAGKYFPEAKPYKYTTSQWKPESNVNEVTKLSTMSTIEYRSGRPSAPDVFDLLEDATCPGIFMCGPVGLTDMVKKYARIENSVGLTRYALYEEPFEM